MDNFNETSTSSADTSILIGSNSSTTPSISSNSSTPIAASTTSNFSTPIAASTTTATPSSSVPPWGIAIIALLALVFVIGIIALAWLYTNSRRKKKEEAFGGQGADRPKLGVRPPIIVKIVDKSEKSKLQSEKSPTSRAKAIAAAMTAGRTPVLPHKRLAVEVRTSKRTDPRGAFALTKGKLFSVSGKPVVSLVDAENGQSPKPDSTPDSDKKPSRLATVKKFLLGKKSRASIVSKTSADEKAGSKSDEATSSSKSQSPGGQPTSSNVVQRKSGTSLDGNKSSLSGTGSMSRSHESHDTPPVKTTTGPNTKSNTSTGSAIKSGPGSATTAPSNISYSDKGSKTAKKSVAHILKKSAK